MLQRLIIALVLVLLFGFAADAEPTCTAPCVRHAPLVRLLERVRLAEPGETVEYEAVIRNADTCACPASCLQLSPGYHPPNGFPEPFPGLRITRTRLRNAQNQPLNGTCLAPGEEQRARLLLTLAAEQDGPGYVTPVITAERRAFPCREFVNGAYVWGAGCFESEGDALCAAMDYATCRAFVYDVGPAR